MGYFHGAVDPVAVTAGVLGNWHDPQLGVWGASPLAVELEQHCLATLAGWMGFPTDSLHATFTTGATESNLTATVLSLAKAQPRFVAEGVRSFTGRPMVYASAEAHGSVHRAAVVTGMGRQSVRVVPCDDEGRMRVKALERMVVTDRSEGKCPVMVVSTAGTTASGAMDPLVAIGDFAGAQGLWHHCDAAFGAMAAFSRETLALLDGISRADSVAWDAHKTMPVPLGAGMFFTVGESLPREVFHVATDYLSRAGRDDDRVQPHTSTLQWSRRAIGLPVFAVMAARGREGLAARVETLCARAEYLREALRGRGWTVYAGDGLPVVCVRHEAPGKVAGRLRRDGVAWVADTRVGGRWPVLRFCVTNEATTEAELDAVIEALGSPA